MKSMKLFAMAFLGLGLSACDSELEIKDGRIPAEFLPVAQLYVGNYRGQVERQAMNATLALDGDKLTLTTAEDLVGSACESKIGNLQKILYRERDKQIQITEAIFELDPNLCGNNVEGRAVTLTFLEDKTARTFDLRYLDHQETQWDCSGYYDDPWRYSPACRRVWVKVYTTGRFVRN